MSKLIYSPIAVMSLFWFKHKGPPIIFLCSMKNRCTLMYRCTLIVLLFIFLVDLQLLNTPLKKAKTFTVSLICTVLFYRIISARWNDSAEVHKGSQQLRKAGSKPHVSCTKSLVDCCSRTFRAPLQSGSTLPAREQHNTGPGASLMDLCLSRPLSSHQHAGRMRSTWFLTPFLCRSQV